MTTQSYSPRYAIKQPHNLSPRIQRLCDYCFRGVDRNLSEPLFFGNIFI